MRNGGFFASLLVPNHASLGLLLHTEKLVEEEVQLFVDLPYVVTEMLEVLLQVSLSLL